MNYETATNNQLEDRLASLVGFKPTEFDELACAVVRSLKAEGCVDLYEKETPSPDYCTDISVTWPLMIKHGIELSPCYNGWWLSGVVESYTYEEEPLSYSGVTICEDPLRAIVICLIKVMESK